VLSFGRLPLANSFIHESMLDQDEERYPLDMVYCPGCTLVQITETVDPRKLFREYLYLSSTSERVLRNAAEMAARMISERHLDANSTVIEIASNDGYLLQHYAKRGIRSIGIEPAHNVAEIAEAKGVETIREFFDLEVAQKMLADGFRADIIHANNVVAHVADLHGMIAGAALLLKPDGVLVIENAYVLDTIDHLEFDQCYHEHLCYYSAHSFNWLGAQHGLDLVDVELLPIHGGSIRVYFQPERGARDVLIGGAKRMVDVMRDEREWNTHDHLQAFAARVVGLRKELTALLSQIKAGGASIVAYGASAKSTTLLNYFGIGAETLDYMVDNTPIKQGRYTPGTHLQIFPPAKILETQPDFVLLTAWNFADDIIAKEAEYVRRGGKFIIPIPEVVVK
jgi:SAM-dependent methyltransferase